MPSLDFAVEHRYPTSDEGIDRCRSRAWIPALRIAYFIALSPNSLELTLNLVS